MASDRSTVNVLVRGVATGADKPGLFATTDGVGLPSGLACFALSRVCFENRMSCRQLGMYFRSTYILGIE